MKLANPRGFCAGVVRAVEAVERALERHAGPVYVLHEIVHNRRVVDELAARGAVFVERLEEVPDDALVVFSAHGVAPAIELAAERRALAVIDATCPLVAKVHREAERHARESRDVVLVGHAGHREIEGTLGRFEAAAREAGSRARLHLVATPDDVAALEVRDPERLAWITQTTLSVEDTATIVSALEARFPAIEGPRGDDICYATQNRQRAVRELAVEIDLLLVVGARNSSNTQRLRELGERLGVPSRLVPDAAALDPAWLAPGLRVGVTAGASAPESLVRELLAALRRHGVRRIVERAGEPERVRFAPPTIPLERLCGTIRRLRGAGDVARAQRAAVNARPAAGDAPST